ncbi:MAG: c-type cytochrome biogenesis protein CcmI [Burkholderiales bacterium]
MFWALAGVLALSALLFVLPPLLRARRTAPGVSAGSLNIGVHRDQLRELDADLASGAMSRERYDEAKSDIERRLIEEGGDAAAPRSASSSGKSPVAWIVGLLLPILATGLYFVIGAPGVLSPEVQQGAKNNVTPEQIAAMIEKLAARMKEKPDDPEGWIMLGRSYSVIGKFPEAASAYASAAKLLPDNAQVLADQADTLGMAQGGTLIGPPEQIIARALQLDPANPKALSLMGTAAYERGDFPQAITMWERLLKVVPPDSEFAASMKASIGEARTRAAAVGTTVKPLAASDPRQVSGTVQLAPAFAARVAPGDTVFIFARSSEGPRMPLAILRKQVSELPIKFVLDDSLAMSPTATLSGATLVVVGARVSKSGDAKPQKGDFEGFSAPLKVGTLGVAIMIDTEVP